MSYKTISIISALAVVLSSAGCGVRNDRTVPGKHKETSASETVGETYAETTASATETTASSSETALSQNKESFSLEIPCSYFHVVDPRNSEDLTISEPGVKKSIPQNCLHIDRCLNGEVDSFSYVADRYYISGVNLKNVKPGTLEMSGTCGSYTSIDDDAIAEGYVTFMTFPGEGINPDFIVSVEIDENGNIIRDNLASDEEISDADSFAYYDYYGSIIENASTVITDPNGGSLGEHELVQYALADIDNDNIKELIAEYDPPNGAEVGRNIIFYDIENGSVTESEPFSAFHMTLMYTASDGNGVVVPKYAGSYVCSRIIPSINSEEIIASCMDDRDEYSQYEQAVNHYKGEEIIFYSVSDVQPLLEKNTSGRQTEKFLSAYSDGAGSGSALYRYKALYKEKLMEIAEQLDTIDADVNITYTLCDMNHDGIPEMAVKTGTCEADYKMAFYSYSKENGVVLVGDNFFGFHITFYIDKATDSFCTIWGQNGIGGIRWYSFDGAKVTESRTQDNIEFATENVQFDNYDDAFAPYGDFEILNYSSSYRDGYSAWFSYAENGEMVGGVDRSLITNY